MPAVAELLDDDITWYESTAGMEGVYHLRDGRITAHWHLAVDPKADAEAASELFAS